MTASTAPAPARTTVSSAPFTASGDLYIVADLQGKGGNGKTTNALANAARAAELGFRTLLLDVDTQASAYNASKAMGDACPYTYLHETDPQVIAQIRAAAGFQRIYIDTAGNLQQMATLAEVLGQVDLVIVPYDATPLSYEPTLRTVAAILEAGAQYRILLNNVPTYLSTSGILGMWQKLHAATFCLRCGLDSECAGGCDTHTGTVTLPVFIRRYAAWQASIDAGVPITAYRGGEWKNARTDLAAVFEAIELTLAGQQ